MGGGSVDGVGGRQVGEVGGGGSVEVAARTEGWEGVEHGCLRGWSVWRWVWRGGVIVPFLEVVGDGCLDVVRVDDGDIDVDVEDIRTEMLYGNSGWEPWMDELWWLKMGEL